MRGCGWAAVVGLLAASLDQSFAAGEPRAAGPVGDHRELVAVPGKYIAVAAAPLEGCDKLSQLIEVARSMVVARGGPLSDVEYPPVGSASVARTCYISFQGTEALAAEVRRIDGVDYVEHDSLGGIAATGPLSWGLDRIDQSSLPLDNNAFPFRPNSTDVFSGEGVVIYVLDTGINSSHPEFTGRVLQSPDLSGENVVEDENGHGTHVAGVAAGTSVGVATGATIIGVKVCSSDGRCLTSSVVKGVEWATVHAKGSGGILLMSLRMFPSLALDQAVREAVVNRGLIATVAAGNTNQDACTTSPGRAGGSGSVLTVAASTKDDSRAWFSSYGTCTDLFAPGEDIYSAWSGGESLYKYMSGTSMATPHVAGVAAILLAKHAELPALERRATAQTELLSLTNTGVISDTMGSPNRLLQLPTEGQDPDLEPPTVPVIPTGPPSAWVCLDEYWNDGFGCDCGCGGLDPDCDIPGIVLWCNGVPQVDLECINDQCTASNEDGGGIASLPDGETPGGDSGSESDSGVERGVPSETEDTDKLEKGVNTSSAVVFASMSISVGIVAGLAFGRARRLKKGQPEASTTASVNVIAPRAPAGATIHV